MFWCESITPFASPVVNPRVWETLPSNTRSKAVHRSVSAHGPGSALSKQNGGRVRTGSSLRFLPAGAAHASCVWAGRCMLSCQFRHRATARRVVSRRASASHHSEAAAFSRKLRLDPAAWLFSCVDFRNFPIVRALKHNQLPFRTPFVETQNVEVAVIAYQLEVAVLRAVPFIEVVGHLDLAPVEAKAPRHLNSGMASGRLNRHAHGTPRAER